MLKFTLLVYLLLCADVQPSQARWGIRSIHDMFSRFSRDASNPNNTCGESDVSRRFIFGKAKENPRCDENQMLLQLARMYIISPERIILLVTMDSLDDTCKDVTDVMTRINLTLLNCSNLPASNLYLKLHDGLAYFHSYICGFEVLGKHLKNYHDCLIQLRDDLIDCEGPPDWFEKKNKSHVCQYMNDIVNCNYIKAAMLCGLGPALLLRNFSIEIMNRVVVTKCKVSKSLPHVADPMPAVANQLKPSLCCIFILMFLHIIINKY